MEEDSAEAICYTNTGRHAIVHCKTLMQQSQLEVALADLVAVQEKESAREQRLARSSLPNLHR